MICGLEGGYRRNLKQVIRVIGRAEGVREISALSVLVLSHGSYFLSDTHVTVDPSAEELAEMTVLAAHHVRRFGIEPKIALLSHSNFGSSPAPCAAKVRKALSILHKNHPELEVEGEMRGDAALDEKVRARLFPSTRLDRPANLMIMPSLDAANIAYNLHRLVQVRRAGIT